jgi:hypothetical protein
VLVAVTALLVALQLGKKYRELFPERDDKPYTDQLAEVARTVKWAFGPGLAAYPAHWPPGNPLVDASIAADGLTGRITVPLRARGALLGVVAFSRSDRPEAFTADDLILAEELTAKAAVAIDNARRYSRERTTALTLQRSLLPQRLANHEAVDVASRYLPTGTDAEVGGDWFDVIPLSGARVALVARLLCRFDCACRAQQFFGRHKQSATWSVAA